MVGTCNNLLCASKSKYSATIKNIKNFQMKFYFFTAAFKLKGKDDALIFFFMMMMNTDANLQTFKSS